MLLILTTSTSRSIEIFLLNRKTILYRVREFLADLSQDIISLLLRYFRILKNHLVVDLDFTQHLIQQQQQQQQKT